MDVTILEFHLDDARFNAPFAGGDAKDDADTDDEVAGASDGGFDPKPLVVIAVLAGLALLARYLRSREDGGVEVGSDELEIGGS